jgi:hypothetical protein
MSKSANAPRPDAGALAFAHIASALSGETSTTKLPAQKAVNDKCPQPPGNRNTPGHSPQKEIDHDH